MSDPLELMKKLENMSDDEKLEFLMKAAKEKNDAMTIDHLGRFIVHGLKDQPEHIIGSILLSVIVNMGISKSMCPQCFAETITEAVADLFEMVEIEDDEHDYKFKDADRIAEFMKDGATTH